MRVSARDLAGVSGLPSTAQALRRLAIREHWPYTEEPCRGGRRRLYRVADLPPDVQAALARLHDAPPPADAPTVPPHRATPPDSEALWARAQRAAAWDKAQMLQEIDPRTGQGLSRTAAIRAVAETAGVSVATLYRWLARTAGMHPGDHEPALLPSARAPRGRAEMPAAAFQHWLADYLDRRQPTAASCYARLQARAGHEGWTLPSLKTLLRRLAREIDPAVVILRREGEHALARRYPAQQRSVAGLHAMQWMNGDGYQPRPNVRWPDGTVSRPVIWWWQDIYSRKILSWRLDRSENADLIRLTLADLLDQWGVPEHITLDNTRDAVQVAIYDFLYSDETGLPESSYSEADVGTKTEAVFQHVYQVYPTLPSPYYETVAAA